MTEGLSADLRALERSIGAAVVASLPLLAPERPAFIGRHLLAQLDDAPLPVAEGEERAPTEAEFRQLAELLSKHLNATKGMAGWPARCLAARLMLQDLAVVQPQQPNELDTQDIQQLDTKWDRLGASSLKTALLNTDLIDAEWLAGLADSGGILPRCQQVPLTAKVSLAEMEAWNSEYTVGVLIISYPWLGRTHPDPHGEQLQKIAFVLKAYAAEARKVPGCRVGVFWDYASLPQRNREGVEDRTESE